MQDVREQPKPPGVQEQVRSTPGQGVVWEVRILAFGQGDVWGVQAAHLRLCYG